MLFFLSASGSDERRTKLEIIYREYRDLMLYIANGILGDTNDSEDVVHQSILKLVKVLDKIDAPKSHKTRALVVTVVERTAIDLYRRRQRTNTISLDEDLLVVAPSSPIPAADTRIDLSAAMASLPVRYRQVLFLRYDSGLSCREIAGLLSMTEANVRKTIQRAKETLGEILEKGGYLDANHR